MLFPQCSVLSSFLPGFPLLGGSSFDLDLGPFIWERQVTTVPPQELPC